MDFIKTVSQVYGKLEDQPQLNIPELVNDLSDWFYRYPQYHFLHPCIINGKAALVCHAQLSQLSPLAFTALEEITEKHVIFLKQDSRTAEQQHGLNRRTNAAVVLGFCLGMISTPVLSRDRVNESLVAKNQVTAELVSTHNHLSAQVKQTNGQLVISLRHAKPPSAEQVLNAYKEKKQLQTIDANSLVKISTFLKKAYQHQQGDPVSIRVDLQKMAKYYAQYPRVVELISELSEKNVLLKYKKSHWQAQALGTQYAVEQVTVMFDTRVGAQLWMHPDCKANPACNITPADALLHELLHAKLMIVDSDEFIHNGGMKPTLYLFDHEKQVIVEENALYSEMSQQDGLARPIRRKHSGDLLYASCALCLPGH